MPMIMTMSSDPLAPPPRVEVITSVQRRRRGSPAEKVRLVEETLQPGMSVSFVARRAGIAPSQLFAWKRGMLSKGDVVILDNLAVHKSQKAALCPKQRGPGFCFCPPIRPISTQSSKPSQRSKHTYAR